MVIDTKRKRALPIGLCYSSLMIEPTDLNLRHLDAALAVRRLGSVTAAAATVNLSQPSLTQALSRLEERLGERLFDRRSDGVEPTDAGILFTNRIERCIDRLGEGCRAIRRAARLPVLSFPERHVSTTQLRAFLAVERTRSFVLAARGLQVSQPSVHRAARELELILGVPLLVRVRQGTRATAAGERLARDIRLALAELRAGLEELAELHAKGAGRIIIGALPLPRAGLLPRALARFASTWPKVEISIVEAAYPDLLSELQSGEIDLLLGALRPLNRDLPIRQQSLFEDDLYVVAAAGHPLAGTSPTVQELANFPWVVGPPEAPMRATWDALFTDVETPNRQIQCASILTARGLLLEGEWLALMSPDQFRLEQRAGLLTPVGNPVPGSRRQIGLTTRADWRPTASQAAMIDVLLRSAVTEIA